MSEAATAESGPLLPRRPAPPKPKAVKAEPKTARKPRRKVRRKMKRRARRLTAGSAAEKLQLLAALVKLINKL